MTEPGIGWVDAAWRVREFYAALEQTPTIQVELGSEVEDRLAAARLHADGRRRRPRPARPVPQALRSLRSAAPDAEAAYDESPGRLTVSLASGAASARAVLSGDWLLVDNVQVDPAQRRRGLATGVLAELLDWGASQGARTALLHVETDNAGAIALYERHGFVTHHTNRYLTT